MALPARLLEQWLQRGPLRVRQIARIHEPKLKANPSHRIFLPRFRHAVFRQVLRSSRNRLKCELTDLKSPAGCPGTGRAPTRHLEAVPSMPSAKKGLALLPICH
jgi:hypothetical protein